MTNNTHTYDPQAGTGNLVFTAHGWQARTDVEAQMRAEAARLRTQEPHEPEFA